MSSDQNLTVLMIVPTAGFNDGKHNYSVFIKREIEFLSQAGMIVVPLYLKSRFNFKVMSSFRGKVKAAIAEYRPDILHIQTGTAGLFLLGSNVKLPTVVTIGGSELLGYSGNSFWWRVRGYLASFVTKKVCSKVDCIICVSENLANAVPAKYRNKVEVLPRAVNTSFFKPLDKFKARVSLGWDLETYYVLFSDPRPYMKVKNRSLADKVIHLSSKTMNKCIILEIIYNKSPNDVVEMLNAADAILVTSFHEGSPNIVKEAMACNLPVVSVDCGDVKERLEGVFFSFICSYNVEALSVALISVLKENSRSNGREILNKQGLSSNSFSKKLVTIYNSI